MERKKVLLAMVIGFVCFIFAATSALAAPIEIKLGHVDKVGDIYGYPIPGHCQWGTRGIECVTHPEGVIGKAKLADPKKAYKTIETFLDYVVKLHNDILAKFPPGVLPPIEMMTKRDKAEMEAIIKGPGQPGGRHLYTLGFPP